MLADRGMGRNESQYLFTVDRFTGEADIVNTGAFDLGGSLKGGRGFTQFLGIEPADMTWVPYPDHYVKGVDDSHGPHGFMLVVCPVIDAVVELDIETGFARGTFVRDNFFLYDDPSRRATIGAGRALAYDGYDLWMWGLTGRSVQHNNEGLKSYAQLYKFPNPKDSEGNVVLELQAHIVQPVGSPVIYGRTTAEQKAYTEAYHAFKNGEGPEPHGEESHVVALCFDGQHLYGSGADMQALYIVDGRRVNSSL